MMFISFFFSLFLSLQNQVHAHRIFQGNFKMWYLLSNRSKTANYIVKSIEFSSLSISPQRLLFHV